MPHVQPAESFDEDDVKKSSRPDIDGESFTFELPTKFSYLVQNKRFREKIKEETKVDDLNIRVLPSKEDGEFLDLDGDF